MDPSMLLVRLAGWTRRVVDSRGQTLAEYSMVITIIAVAAVVLAAILLREELAATYTRRPLASTAPADRTPV